MKTLMKRTGILIIALSAVACAERSITDTPRAIDAGSAATLFSLSALPGADVIVDFEPLSAGIWYLPFPFPLTGQDDWSSLGADGSGCAVYDHQIVVNALGGYTYPTFGLQSLRLSNAVTSGCFGDQTFSKRL